MSDLARSLRRIAAELRVEAREASDDNPLDPEAALTAIRRIEAQAEMLERGLVE